MRMGNAGDYQDIALSCKENDVTFKRAPIDSPKLNNMVDRGFVIR